MLLLFCFLIKPFWDDGMEFHSLILCSVKDSFTIHLCQSAGSILFWGTCAISQQCSLQSQWAGWNSCCLGQIQVWGRKMGLLLLLLFVIIVSKERPLQYVQGGNRGLRSPWVNGLAGGWEHAGPSGTCVVVQLSEDRVVQGAVSGRWAVHYCRYHEGCDIYIS